jgi:hypothetical protein
MKLAVWVQQMKYLRKNYRIRAKTRRSVVDESVPLARLERIVRSFYLVTRASQVRRLRALEGEHVVCEKCLDTELILRQEAK